MRKYAMIVRRVLTCLILIGAQAAIATADESEEGSLPATRVTLHVKDIPARQALDELQKQTGVTFDGEDAIITRRLTETHVTIDADAKPMLAVLLDVCDATGLRPTRHLPGRLSIVLGEREGGWASQFTSVRGAIAIGISKIEHDQRIAYGSKEGSPATIYSMMMEVDVEPAALPRAQEITDVHLDNCLDEDGFAIQTLGKGNVMFSGNWPAIINLSVRTDSASRIAELEGRCTVRVATTQKRIDAPDILNTRDLTVDIGLGHVQIKQLQKQGRQYVLQAVIMRGNMEDAEFEQLVKSAAASKPVLLNAAGQPIAAQGGRGTRAVPSGTQLSISFLTNNDREVPASMTWNIATGVKDVELPFSFKDVPLPAPPAVIMAAKSAPAVEPILTPRMTARPSVVLTPVVDTPRDFAKEVQEIAQMFGSAKPEPKQDAIVRLGLLPPAAFDAVKAAAKSDDIPAAAKKPLNDYIERNEPLLEARVRRAKVLLDQHLWDEKTDVEAYGKIGNHDPKWDAMVLQGIHAFCFAPNEDALMDARKAFENAIDAGCDDALVLSMAAFAIERTGGNPRQVLRLYEQANKDLSASKYNAYSKIWNTIHYTSLLRRTASAEAVSKGNRSFAARDSAALSRLRSELILLWPDACQTGAPPDGLLRAARRIMSIHTAAGVDIESIYKPVAKALNDALPGKPQPLVFKGIFYTDWAWQARGGGLANAVTEEGWKLFAQRLAVAEEALQQAYELDPNDPAAANNRMVVELGQGKGVLDVWFDRAMKADPDDYEACANKLLYIEPKWNGSPQEMLRFGEACYRSGDYAGHLPMILADAHKALAAYLPRKETYFANPAVWPDIQKVYEPYLRVRPDDVEARSAYCSYACLSGNWNIAAKQFGILGDNVMPAWFGSLDDVKQMRERAQQKTGPKDAL